ncbi:MAG: hypothetical protein IJU45_01965 [Clostridia bacterium]|nr:hypothetical protein [Clostridia bacterium]
MKKSALIIITALMLVLLCSCSEAVTMMGGILGSEKYVQWESISAEPTENGSKYKNYFEQLDDKQKKGYNNILKSVYEAEEEFPERVEVPLMSADELSKVFEAVVYDNPDLMCFGRDCSIITEGKYCYFKPKYTMDLEEFIQKRVFMENMADEIISQMDVSYTQFERELFIHDYIIKNCRYSRDGDFNNLTYSCIVDSFASCEGYAKATKYLLEKAGIECYTVIGDASDDGREPESHMWNIVNIEGGYYYLDTTWDDPNTSSGEASHIYFNLTQSELEKDHGNFPVYFECSSTKYNYFNATGKLFKTYRWSDDEKIISLLGKEAKKGGDFIEIKFTNKAAYSSAVYNLAKQGKAYDLVKSVNRRYGAKLKSNNISYSQAEEFLVFSLKFE